RALEVRLRAVVRLASEAKKSDRRLVDVSRQGTAEPFVRATKRFGVSRGVGSAEDVDREERREPRAPCGRRSDGVRRSSVPRAIGLLIACDVSCASGARGAVLRTDGVN